jgi:uncharacterized protein DUF1189
LYLLLLLAAAWLPMAIRMQFGWHRFEEGQGADFVKQIPPITISQGAATVDASQPYFITDPGTGKVFAILDTTGSVQSPEESGATLLLSRDRVIFRRDAYESRVYSLAQVSSFSLDKERAARWLRLVRWLLPFVYAALVACSFLFRGAEALLLGLLGLWVARVLRVSLTYPALLAVAEVSLTPAIVIETLMENLGRSFPFSWLAFLGLSAIYVVFGVAASVPPPAGTPELRGGEDPGPPPDPGFDNPISPDRSLEQTPLRPPGEIGG